ncbi:MAG: hypothetical protein JO132_17545 [Streptosporangiaceae bacterium]|nr:hypothetical protein [Streptosporangiaceae bacterium]
MDQATRNDIAAAAAAHHELGRDYDGAVAESLIDRIGAEIDKRVDARLGAGSSDSRSPAKSSRSGKAEALFIGAGIGAGITGIGAMIAGQSGEHNVVGWVIVIWIILAAAGLGRALVRMYRGRER